jgi:hypothetical protein
MDIRSFFKSAPGLEKMDPAIRKLARNVSLGTRFSGKRLELRLHEIQHVVLENIQELQDFIRTFMEENDSERVHLVLVNAEDGRIGDTPAEEVQKKICDAFNTYWELRSHSLSSPDERTQWDRHHLKKDHRFWGLIGARISYFHQDTRKSASQGAFEMIDELVRIQEIGHAHTPAFCFLNFEANDKFLKTFLDVLQDKKGSCEALYRTCKIDPFLFTASSLLRFTFQDLSHEPPRAPPGALTKKARPGAGGKERKVDDCA